jgi:alkyldihydroxyacetonephosphate synthase
MGAFSDTFEVAAPWSRLKDVHVAVREALGEHALVLSHLSHAYPDGSSIYFTFIGAAREREELGRYDAAWRAGLLAARRAGATLSHHHGIGRSKASALALELGSGVSVLSALRRAWDPEKVLNPGVLDADASDADVASAPDVSAVDAESLLASFSGDTTLAAARDALEAYGLGLPVDSEPGVAQTLDEWIGSGMPGTPDPLHDPVDHVVAGFEARLRNGQRIGVRPGPRRAMGPDFGALFVGTQGGFGAVERVTLRVRPLAGSVAPLLAHGVPRAAESESERRAWSALERAFDP